jgi:peroxiredoxin
LADYGSKYDEFLAAGVDIVAISVDPPERSATMRDDLQIRFPILSDTTRKTIIEWGLLNANEKGGIAIPSTFLIEPGLSVRFASTEGIASRIPASEMLALVCEPLGAKTPAMRGINPGLMFVRAIGNAFRHGVRVKRS